MIKTLKSRSIMASILVAATLLGLQLLVEGASFELNKPIAMDQAQNLPSRNNPEFDLEAIRQQARQLLRYRRFANLARKQQQLMNNEADVAALVASNVQQQSKHPNVLGGPANNQQLSFEDEQNLRQKLPELIAQAHTDKNVERALLKMLINASLRSAMSNMATPMQSAYYGPMRGRLTNNNNGDNWQEGAAMDGGDASDLAHYPPSSSRFDDSQFVNIGNDLDQSLQLQDPSSSPSSSSSYGQASSMDKREYIKPCSFNAVSCGKNPFRKF